MVTMMGSRMIVSDVADMAMIPLRKFQKRVVMCRHTPQRKR